MVSKMQKFPPKKANHNLDNKIVLVVRKTPLDDLIARFNTEAQAQFYIEHLGGDFAAYQQEHQIYKQAIRQAERTLCEYGRLQILDRSFVPNFIFGPQDTVVVLGQDGLVANVLKYLDGQPLIGVNPDPQRWEGKLLPFTLQDLSKIIPDIFQNKHHGDRITMAQVTLNNGERLWAVNDLFIGPRSHISARYQIQIGDRQEYQSSSGIIVSTGLGSTGWFRSIIAGAQGIANAWSESPLNLETDPSFPWDANYLYFSVREPWSSKLFSSAITFGKITATSPLILKSQMPENGVIFSDGIESDFLWFNSGTEAIVGLATKQGFLVT